MSQPDNAELCDAGLEADADFATPLKRVSYQPGMLLGLEATRAEQAYHRRHLNRHNYWLEGAGTLAGLRVSATGDDPGNDTAPARVRLLVSPGVGIDGLGREVYVHEPYCIDLGAWLTTQYEEKAQPLWEKLIRDGYDAQTNLLWLKVTMRYQENPSGLQPVLAMELNAGSDPVKPNRLIDSVLFELVAERPDPLPAADYPFAAHNPLPAWSSELNSKLTKDEQAKIASATDGAKARLQLGARLLYALSDDSQALLRSDSQTTSPAEAARTLLACVAVRLTQTRELIVNPRRVQVDNLARRFLFNAATVAPFAR